MRRSQQAALRAEAARARPPRRAQAAAHMCPPAPGYPQHFPSPLGHHPAATAPQRSHGKCLRPAQAFQGLGGCCLLLMGSYESCPIHQWTPWALNECQIARQPRNSPTNSPGAALPAFLLPRSFRIIARWSSSSLGTFQPLSAAFTSELVSTQAPGAPAAPVTAHGRCLEPLHIVPVRAVSQQAPGECSIQHEARRGPKPHPGGRGGLPRVVSKRPGSWGRSRTPAAGGGPTAARPRPPRASSALDAAVMRALSAAAFGAKPRAPNGPPPAPRPQVGQP